MHAEEAGYYEQVVARCDHEDRWRKLLIDMVPGAGIEPARPNGRGILSPLRLPIPPSGPDVR